MGAWAERPPPRVRVKYGQRWWWRISQGTGHLCITCIYNGLHLYNYLQLIGVGLRQYICASHDPTVSAIRVSPAVYLTDDVVASACTPSTTAERRISGFSDWYCVWLYFSIHAFLVIFPMKNHRFQYQLKLILFNRRIINIGLHFAFFFFCFSV